MLALHKVEELVALIAWIQVSTSYFNRNCYVATNTFADAAGARATCAAEMRPDFSGQPGVSFI